MIKTKLQKTIQVLNKFDPISLLALGAPEDEYAEEAKQILWNVNPEMSAKEIDQVIKKIFIDSFDVNIVGKYDFRKIAKEIKLMLAELRVSLVQYSVLAFVRVEGFFVYDRDGEEEGCAFIRTIRVKPNFAFLTSIKLYRLLVLVYLPGSHHSKTKVLFQSFLIF